MSASNINTDLLLSTDKGLKQLVIDRFGTCKLNNCSKCKQNNFRLRDEFLYQSCHYTKECNIKTYIKLQGILRNSGDPDSDTLRIQKAIKKSSMLGLQIIIKSPWVIFKSENTELYTILNLNTMQIDPRRYNYIRLGKSILLGNTTGGIVIRSYSTLDNIVDDLERLELFVGKSDNIYKDIAICYITDANGKRFTLIVHSSGKRIITAYTKDIFIRESEGIYYVIIERDNIIKLDSKFNIVRTPIGIPVLDI